MFQNIKQYIEIVTTIRRVHIYIYYKRIKYDRK